jgi:hypothetical protein
MTTTATIAPTTLRSASFSRAHNNRLDTARVRADGRRRPDPDTSRDHNHSRDPSRACDKVRSSRRGRARVRTSDTRRLAPDICQDHNRWRLERRPTIAPVRAQYAWRGPVTRSPRRRRCRQGMRPLSCVNPPMTHTLRTLRSSRLKAPVRRSRRRSHSRLFPSTDRRRTAGDRRGRRWQQGIHFAVRPHRVARLTASESSFRWTKRLWLVPEHGSPPSCGASGMLLRGENSRDAAAERGKRCRRDGADAGLGVVGALLVVVTVILATAVMFKGRSLAPNRIKLPPTPPPRRAWLLVLAWP